MNNKNKDDFSFHKESFQSHSDALLASARESDLHQALVSIGVTMRREGESSYRINGNDGLIIWFSKRQRRWMYTHHLTGVSGDGIDLMTKNFNYTFKEAITHLAEHSLSASLKTAPSFKLDDALNDIWQQCMEIVIENAQYHLFEDERCKDYLDYLHSRGLTDETIRTRKFGVMPVEFFAKYEEFGLEEVLKEDGTPKKFWIPEGLLIPCIEDGHIVRVKVRRSAGKEPRFFNVPGSRNMSYILNDFDEDKSVVVVESELDGILISQETNDFVNIVVLGGASVRPKKYHHDILQKAPSVLVSLDADKAGYNHSLWWEDNFDNSQYWPVPEGKDPSEYYQVSDGELVDWINDGLDAFVYE